MMKHTVSAFEDDLSALSQKIAAMGGLAEQALGNAIQALTRTDLELAKAVIDGDQAIDDMERDIEETAILILARRQPMATDLREVISTLRVASDLERIGDLAKNIAKRVVSIDEKTMKFSLVMGLETMTERAQLQLKNVLDAYGRRDVELALDVWTRDREIDAMYTSLFRELLTYMIEDPRLITSATHLLFGAKNIERIGDHATNIAETIHYVVTGTTLDENRPKSDTSFAAIAGGPAAD